MTLETIQLDLATAERLVAAVDPGLRVTAVVRLAGGRNDSVFEVKTADAGSLVVKLYPREWRWMMKKERFALDLLRDHRVDAPVPVVLAADDSEEVLPHSLLVMTKLEGRHPDSVDEQDVAAFNREAGALLATLHEIRFEGFGYVGGEGVVEPRATNLEYMRSRFEREAA